MTLNEITTAANAFTDENFAASTIKVFADEAIAKINVELKSDLPYLHSSSAYTALDDKYLRTTIVPYVCYSIKMNDGSLNEAEMFKRKWQEGLFTLSKQKKLAISEEYRAEGFDTAFLIKQYGRF